MIDLGAAGARRGGVGEVPLEEGAPIRERGAVSTGGGVRSALLLAAASAALVVLGVVLGVLGAFLNAATPLGVPVGPIVAVVGNLTAGVLGTRGLSRRLGGLLPGLGWFTVVALFGSLRAEGDLLIQGDARGVIFIVAGALAAAAALLPGVGSPRAGRSQRP